MKSKTLISALLLLAVAGIGRGDDWAARLDKDAIIARVKAIKGLGPAEPLTAETPSLKCGLGLSMALQALRDEIDPALLARLLDRPDAQTYINTEHFRIHYDTTGGDAPPPIDINPANGIPDYVDSTALIFEHVWTHEIDSLNYASILPDGEPVSDGGQGGDSRYDVYLSNLGQLYFGITWEETLQPNGRTYSSYMQVENDFAEFGAYGYADNPMAAMKVTAAHEFFHALHYSIDAFEYTEGRAWWYEVSSVWMEDVVFDEVNDYRFYLKYFFNYPWLGLETYSLNLGDIPRVLHPYASCVWARYLNERFNDRDIIRRIWEICGAVPGYNVLSATDQVLNDSGYTFEQAFSEFLTWNYFTANRADTVNKYSEANFWINPISGIPDTLKLRYSITIDPYFYQDIPDDSTRNPIDTTFSDLEFTPEPLSANYLVFKTFGSFYRGGLRYDFYGDDTPGPSNGWRGLVLGWDPAQDSLYRFNVNPSSGYGLATIRGWERYDYVVAIPWVFGFVNDLEPTGYSFRATYDPDLSGNSPYFLELPSDYAVKAGDCLDLDILAVHPTGDSTFFDTEPPLDSLNGFQFIGGTLVSGDTTMTSLRFCPGYNLVDSTIGIIIYARDTSDHYDAKQLVFSVIYFPPSSRSSIRLAAYPNPLIYEEHQVVTLRYSLRDSVNINDMGLYIFNVAGDLVFDSTMAGPGVLGPGEYYINWDFRNNLGQIPAGGIYIIKFRAGDNSASEKIAVIR